MDFIFSVLFILVVGLFPYNLVILAVVLFLRHCLKTDKEDGQEDLPENIEINGQKYKKDYGNGGSC